MHELEREQVNFGVASNERNHTIGFPVDHLEARLRSSSVRSSMVDSCFTRADILVT
jgi:hypothetical protein